MHIYTAPDYAGRHELFYRDINSAILDAAKYPYLRSTPLWVRLLFSSLSDGARTALTAWFLRLQLMVMYYMFDFWPYLGSIPLDIFWTWRPFGDRAPLLGRQIRVAVNERDLAFQGLGWGLGGEVIPGYASDVSRVHPGKASWWLDDDI